MKKPGCYECKHRREVPGSAHTRCDHPHVQAIGLGDNVFSVMAAGLTGKTQGAAEKLNIKGNPHGIRNGWFIWPGNFDPVWLESCDGWEEGWPWKHKKEREKP